MRRRLVFDHYYDGENQQEQERRQQDNLCDLTLGPPTPLPIPEPLPVPPPSEFPFLPLGQQMLEASTSSLPPLSPQNSFFQQFFSIPPPPAPQTFAAHNRQCIPITAGPNPTFVVHDGAGPSRRRRRKSPVPILKNGKVETVPAPYPWAMNRRAKVYTLESIVSKGITTISGNVECKRCERAYEMEYDLQEKFIEVATFILENKLDMHDRAPPIWMYPTLPDCRFCEQSNCVKPVSSGKKRGVNWLFLLLGQLLGCCKLSELKYFCKHTGNHRTGAKDRVLYLAYLGLCKQLDPRGPFDLIDI